MRCQIPGIRHRIHVSLTVFESLQEENEIGSKGTRGGPLRLRDPPWCYSDTHKHAHDYKHTQWFYSLERLTVFSSVAVDFGLDFAFAVAFTFFGAAFLAVVFFVVVVDALLDAAAGSWIRRVVKNVRRVAANADEVRADEGKTLLRSTGRLDAR